VNLIGEHTDYNQGLVLPCAIDRSTWVVAAHRDDARLRVWSEGEQQQSDLDLAAASAREPGGFSHWSDYVACVVRAMAEAGHAVPALDLAVASQVPIGAGLSSSAAFTVSLATIFAAAAGTELSARARAEIAHRAESHFLGVGSGILDQYASALGRRDFVLRIDCRTREVEPVAVPPGRLCVLLADSGVRRSLAEADSGYRTRVAECADVVRAARAAGLPAESLRDLSPADLEGLESRLPPALLRRARHVVSENGRVEACCRSLEAGDLASVGALLRDGHRSLRDDYAVSTPELDALCEIADGLPGTWGSRLTGAGWGGCTLHLVQPAAAEEVASRLRSGFAGRFGRRPEVVRIETADGAALLSV
jgi:galactokinase